FSRLAPPVPPHTPAPMRFPARTAKPPPYPPRRKVPAKIHGPSAFVFKPPADPFAGRISFFRVMTGTVKNDANLINLNKSAPERLAHVSTPQGKTLNAVTDLNAGDIGAVAKLKDTLTGDTLAEKGHTVTFPPVN